MDCERCQQNEAKVHITQFINGVKQDTHLCETCAQSLKINLGLPQFPINNLNNLLSFLSKSSGIDKKATENRCPNCQIPYSKIAETGFVGCSECYRHFSTQLEPLLQRIHGAKRHRGKIPKRAGESLMLRREIDDLKSGLKEAVGRENYEEAARLRDQIKELERKMNH